MKTQNRLFQVAFAIFAGAFFGSVVSVRWFEKSFLSLAIGLIAGGAAGYVLLDPKSVAVAVIEAWKECDFGLYFSRVAAWIGRKTVAFLRWAGWTIVFVIVGVAMSATNIVVCLIVSGYSGGDILPASVTMSASLLFSAAMPLCPAMFMLIIGDAAYGKKMFSDLRWSLLPIGTARLITLTVSALYRHRATIGKGVTWFFVHMAKFTALVFRKIHCEARVQTATYAMIGTVVGWKFDSPLVGASVGAILGAIGYSLVTVRLLEAVRPAEAKK
ncbi:MAG TPA: hypothetical protein VFQ72_01185 [Candidatus Paceibacterota bacterium]|nr:hypothetical protein [Candidatus Paceibacterota bacterium]